MHEPYDGEEDSQQERIVRSLKRIQAEHVDLTPDEGTDGLGLYVSIDDDHAFHLLQHKRFIDDPPVKLRTQDVARLRRHMQKHYVAMEEAKQLGLARSFDAAYAETGLE